MKMTFAFLTHPVSLHHVKAFWPFTRLLPASFTTAYLKKETFKIIPLRGLRDSQGNETNGCAIIAPTFLDAIQQKEDEAVFDTIISADALSERLGFRILGLGGYFSTLANKKPMLHKHLKTPVTTGSAFTAWCVFEGAFKAAKKQRLEMKTSTVTILSPANPIGMLCARKFAENANRIILAGEKEEKLGKIKQALQESVQIDVAIENNLAKSVQEASIIVNTDPFHSLVDLDRAKANSIVCDIALCGDIRKRSRKRPDIIAIDNTVVATPFGARAGFYPDFPRNAVCPELAETILLSLKKDFVNYSLGENVHPDKLDYIANLASRHGFEVPVSGAEIN